MITAPVLPTKNINTLVSEQAAAIQALSTQTLLFQTGDVELALIESNAGVGFWLESLLVRLLADTRASTCVGPALDSWMADYGLTRLPGTQATTLITFARNDNSIIAVISAATYDSSGNLLSGTQVQTALAIATYTVIADSANSYYNSSMNAYVIPAGTSSADIPVQATLPGIYANVSENTITVLLNAVSGINTVTNQSPVTNGIDEETDPQFRARFVVYINSLATANEGAIILAILDVQDGIKYNLLENKGYELVNQPGLFTVIIDDGTGTASDQLVANVSAGINIVKGLTINYAVFATNIGGAPEATIEMTILVNSSYDPSAVATLVQNKLISYVQLLAIGQTLYFSELILQAFLASLGVQNVYSITLNGLTTDLTTDAVHTIVTNSGLITINTSP